MVMPRVHACIGVPSRGCGFVLDRLHGARPRFCNGLVTFAWSVQGAGGGEGGEKMANDAVQPNRQMRAATDLAAAAAVLYRSTGCPHWIHHGMYVAVYALSVARTPATYHRHNYSSVPSCPTVLRMAIPAFHVCVRICRHSAPAQF